MASAQVEGDKKYLSNEDLAARYDVPVPTVRDWRRRGLGPVATKLGGLVRYAFEDVLAWEQDCREDNRAARV
jgi:DNA-binding transcriptional MerR regulator